MAIKGAPPLRIAYIMSRFPKITETFILYEILALEEAGFTIEIFPLLKEKPSTVHPEAERLVRRARYHPFLSVPILQSNWRCFKRRPRTYLKTLKEILSGTWGSLNFFVGALGIFPKTVHIARISERIGIDHVHAHFVTHPAVAALIIKRLTGIPFSFTAHGSDLHVERRMLDKKTEAASFGVCVSHYNKELIVKECGERIRDKIHVVRCGVDVNCFPSRPRNNRRQAFQILCIASLEEVKGHRYLIEACRELDRGGIEFFCHLVGDGSLRGQIERQIAGTRLENRIGLYGAQPRPVVLDMLRKADVVALPSVRTAEGKREGIPVVLMEAMASCLPVISTDISGIPELVDAGKTGFLIPPRDSKALTNMLRMLEQDAHLRARVGSAAREKVLREFNLRTNAARLSDLFITHCRRGDPVPPKVSPRPSSQQDEALSVQSF